MVMALQSLRIIGFLEGISYLVLLGVAMPLKYVYQLPEPTYYIGMAHGVLFVTYLLLCLIVAIKYKWNFKTLFLSGIASLFPFTTFVADKKIFQMADDKRFKKNQMK